MAKTFGLITEGPTDQVVLRHLLARYFSDPDIDTRPVQPNTDSTDKMDHFGNWVNVLNYCSGADMPVALQAYEFVIIQIDTDVCEEYGVPKREENRELTSEEIVGRTKAVIINRIGTELFTKYKQKIIFSISFESIECWLLPLYFNDNNRSKTFNCCEKLNQELQRGIFTIDCNSKQVKYYERIFRDKKDKMRNKALIGDLSAHNYSFNQFIQGISLIDY